MPESLVPALCEAIAHEVVALDWGEGRFWPRHKKDLLEARKDCEGVLLLCLYDNEARWGEFEELEKFLREHNIAFDRSTDGKYEFMAELARFRPGRGFFVLPTDPQHEPIVRAYKLVAVDQALAAAGRLLTCGAPKQALESLQEARLLLQRELTPEVPLLETFTIEEDQQT